REEVEEVGAARSGRVDRGVEEVLHLGPAPRAGETVRALEPRIGLIRVPLPEPGEQALGLLLAGGARFLERGDPAEALVRGVPRALLVPAGEGRQVLGRAATELRPHLGD